MVQVGQQIKVMAAFQRGAMGNCFNIFNIMSSDPRRGWMTSELISFESMSNLKRYLKMLLDKGLIIRVDSYPRMYKINLEHEMWK